MVANKILFLSVAVIAGIISCQIAAVNSANILGLFTSHSPSHLIVHMSLVKVLADQGHNVTIVASQVPKVKHDKINMIIIPPTKEQEQIFSKVVAEMAVKKNNIFTTVGNFFGSLAVMIDMQADMLKDPRFTALYDNENSKFDLVIVGFFMNTFELGVAAKLKIPVIISWTASSMLFTDIIIGNPSGVSYVPDMNIVAKNGGKMSFLERLQNLGSNLFFRLIKLLLDFRMRSIYSDLYANDGSIPSLSEMEKNVSLIFCNGHFSEGPIKPHVPAIVEIGGIQVKDTPAPLPEDITEHLDRANKTGAILFSLGSNLKGTSIKPETVTYIFNVLSKLDQQVIWKWEDSKNTPGKSGNILYKKWLPQDDILAHPNTKLFITHAGKGGIAEAQYHAVPMIALPVFADQHGNAKKMVASGYGLYFDLLTLSETDLAAAVEEVLNNPQYKKNVQRFSQLYRDRPLTARENVAYWTDYVLRHHGAAHMQSPLVHMNIIESLNLDVYFLILIVVYVFYKISKFILYSVYAKVCSSRSSSRSSTAKVKSQ